MFRNKSASSHSFAMVPRADIPRSSFRMQKTLKTTMNAGYLVPILCEEVLPGDTWKVRLSAFARLATPIFPVMDNLHFETFFFFVPNRLVWENWTKFMGEQENPDDSISYLVPVDVSAVGGYDLGTVADYFGLPTVGQVDPAQSIEANAMPFRGYRLIWNEWFRDENLQDSQPVDKGDGPDSIGNELVLKRGKRHDYFTSALPFVQKGAAVSIPLTGSATVKTSGSDLLTGVNPPMYMRNEDGSNVAANLAMGVQITTGAVGTAGGATVAGGLYPRNLYADLATTTATTINALRQSFQIQRLLERDARGGTRYTELIRAHFGVISPDARLQRPEYLGGGHQNIHINPVTQTSATDVTGSTTPQGNLSAFGTMLAQGHGFSQSFTEHGYIIGLCNVRADLTYQQGLRRHWSRQTRYDYYFPAFAMLGEQAILNQEIYATGIAAQDQDVFGYQERWAEYRYNPNEITGLFRSTASGTIDPWHLAQNFLTLPELNSDFIEENPPLDRVLAVGSAAQGQQLLLDCFYDCVLARPLPMYSVPGLIDHF